MVLDIFSSFNLLLYSIFGMRLLACDLFASFQIPPSQWPDVFYIFGRLVPDPDRVLTARIPIEQSNDVALIEMVSRCLSVWMLGIHSVYFLSNLIIYYDVYAYFSWFNLLTSSQWHGWVAFSHALMITWYFVEGRLSLQRALLMLLITVGAGYLSLGFCV